MPEGEPGQAGIGQVGSRVHRLKLAQVIHETADARSLVFEVPEEIADRFTYGPGQFLTLRIPSDETGSVARSYSLSSSPHWDEPLTVTVKRTIDGYGSNWLCDNAVEGLELDLLVPSGMFVPKNLDRDFLLVAAGSGITPVMSILKSALRAGSGQVALLYANRDENSVIFAAELERLAADYPDRLTVVHWWESHDGLPTQAGIAQMAAPYADREVYLCGPGPFMAVAEAALRRDLGVSQPRIHIEVFQSLKGDPFAEIEFDDSAEDDRPSVDLEVTLDGETLSFRWPRNAKLLDFLLAKGLDAPFSCREGACSACACIVVEGEVDMLNNEVLEAEDLEEGIRLACQALPVTDSVTVTYDE